MCSKLFYGKWFCLQHESYYIGLKYFSLKKSIFEAKIT